MGGFDVVQIEQGTPEWHVWRAGGIGASDAPTIMRQNPWKSARQLFYERLNTGQVNPINVAMAQGTALEPLARSAYCATTNSVVEPRCIQSRQHPWMRASLDGLSISDQKVVEIKCGVSAYKRTAQSGRVPGYYYGQLQHVLAICGFETIDFWCFLPDRTPILLVVDRDENYIEELIEHETLFWDRLSEELSQGST